MSAAILAGPALRRNDEVTVAERLELNSCRFPWPFRNSNNRRFVLPAQLHLHDPWPLTAQAVPVPQRPVFGTLVMAAPFAEPQARPREGASRRKWLPDGRR